MSPCYIGKLTLIESLYAVLVFLGMLVFSLFGGIGFITLPYDLVNEFIFRPKPIQPEEFKTRSRILLPRVMKLREMGKKLDNERLLVMDVKGITGYIKRYQFG